MSDDSPSLTPVPLDNCALARALALLADKWTLLVVREAFYGLTKFQDFQRDLIIPRTVLSGRLAKLVKAGVLTRRRYRKKGERTRYEYRLTPMGADLLPALVALMQWGERHLPDSDGYKVSLIERDCGSEISAGLICEKGHAVKDLRQIKVKVSV